jgi:hypothetical protein
LPDNSRHIYDIADEPRDELYRSLIRHCAIQCLFISLIVREADWLDAEAVRLLDQLRRHVRSTMRTSAWPGTTLTDGDKATQYTYEVVPDAVELVSRGVDGLYEWQQPARPEDLCLLVDADQPMLVTTAHERDAYLSLEPAEYVRLHDALPALRLTPRSER